MKLLQKITPFQWLLAFVVLAFIAIMTSFSFPDLFAMIYVPHFLFEGNIYTWVVNHKAVCPWVSATWPPLYYYSFGTYLWVIETLHFFPTKLIYANTCPVFDLINDKTFLFWAKFPFLLLHIATAWIFSKFFHKQRQVWFLFWLLNPIAIFVNFMEGQFDSIPTFFLMLGLYIASQKPSVKYSIYCGLALGVGGAFKHYPFLLLLPFFIIFTQNTKQRILFLITAIIPYAVCVPFSFNHDFLQSLAFGENYKMFESGFMLGDIKVSYYLCLYAFLSFMLVFEKNRTLDTLIKYCFLFTSIYFVTSFWFVQRILFLMPPLLLLAGTRKKIMYSLPLLYIAYFVYAFFLFPGLFDHTLLRPIFPAVMPINYELFFPLAAMKSYILSGMVALIIWFMYATAIEKKENETIMLQNITIPVGIITFYIMILLILGFTHA